MHGFYIASLKTFWVWDEPVLAFTLLGVDIEHTSIPFVRGDAANKRDSANSRSEALWLDEDAQEHFFVGARIDDPKVSLWRHP